MKIFYFNFLVILYIFYNAAIYTDGNPIPWYVWTTEKVYSGEASYPCRPTEQPQLIRDKFNPAGTGTRLIDGYDFRNEIDR